MIQDFQPVYRCEEHGSYFCGCDEFDFILRELLTVAAVGIPDLSKFPLPFPKKPEFYPETIPSPVCWSEPFVRGGSSDSAPIHTSKVSCLTFSGR